MTDRASASLFVFAAAFSLAACGTEPVPTAIPVGAEEANESELRAFILGLESPALPPEQAPVPTETTEAAELHGDTLQSCVYRRFEGTAHFESLASFDPNADTLWPGAVVQSEGLSHGLLAPIALPRAPSTITLSGATLSGEQEGYSRTLDVPSLASAQEAIANILQAEQIHLAAKASFVSEQAYSLTEAALKAGVSADWMTGSVKSSFDGDWTSRRSTFVVRFVQSYYTVSVAAPESPERVFTPEVGVAEATPYMGAGNPPGYVSSVTYGRMLFVKVESDAAASEVKAAIDAVFSLGVGDGEASIATEVEKVINEATVTVFALGGDPTDAIEIMTSSDNRAERLRDYFLDGAQFSASSPGVPISYTVRRLADNATIKVASTLDYEVPDCGAAPQTVLVSLHSLEIPSNGESIGKGEIAYKIWLERDGVDTVLVDGSASKVEDGDSVVLDQDHVVQLLQTDGEALRIHAEVSESGAKHVYPSRSHTFVIDPMSLSGSWTQSGLNEVAQSNANLSVRLVYSLDLSNSP